MNMGTAGYLYQPHVHDPAAVNTNCVLLCSFTINSSLSNFATNYSGQLRQEMTELVLKRLFLSLQQESGGLAWV